MAATKKGQLTISATAQEFGDAKGTAIRQDFIFQAPSGNTGSVFLDFNGDEATADEGWYLAPGEAISSQDVPEAFRQGPFSAVGTASDLLNYHFSKARGT